MVRLFASDLHLEDTRPDITRAFFRLLDTFQERIDELYLLGDIFEVWLGDDTPMQCADLLAKKLRDLAKSGVGIFIMRGNRDFLIGQDYARRCDARLIEEPFLLDLAGQSALLMHGDILCSKDTDYLAFRKMVRDPEWQLDFLAKPLEERIAIGRSLRDKSQQSAKGKAEYIMDVTPGDVAATMERHHVRLLIHGHTHRPATHNVTLQSCTGTRMVLGDWHKQGWYILADDNSIRLESFPFPVSA